jgi:hydroxyacylglutathione hydrolase
MDNNQTQFLIDSLELGPMENFIYLIKDLDSGRTAVVDPAWEVPEIIKHCQQKGMQITDVLLTHSHMDHINGVKELLDSYDAQVHLLKAEAQFAGKFLESSVLHHGGDVVKIGETEIKMLHTPGHTPGSACYHVGDHLIAGDTLFVFGCGRCDLAGGDPNQMFSSLRKIKTELPMHTVLYPGHNYSSQATSTLADEVKGNPFLHFHDENEFCQYRMVEHDRIRHSPYQPIPK